MHKAIMFLLMSLLAMPAFAATGTTYIGMIIVIVFVSVMLILYYMVVFRSDKESDIDDNAEKKIPKKSVDN